MSNHQNCRCHIVPKYRRKFPINKDMIELGVVQILRGFGEDVTREGLAETPQRVAKAWIEWTKGYDVDIESLFKVFDDGAEKCDEMVLVANIRFVSHCEHHMAPISGVAHVAYIPTEGIVGLSKMARVVEAFAARLQVQERMTSQIADSIVEFLKPKGCGVLIRAEHGCMSSRGVKQHGSLTTTSALRGCFKSEPETRAEFLKLIEMSEKPRG